MLTIRPAEPAEADTLTALVFASKAAWNYPAGALAAWAPQLAITAGQIATRPVLVAEFEGITAGVYSLAPGGADWELDNLFVAPSLMGQGIGGALFRHAAELARAGGAKRLLIDADPHAEPFYLHQGARRIDVVPAPIEGQPGRVRPQLVFVLAPAAP